MKRTFLILAFFFSFPLSASQDVEGKIQSLCDSLARQFPDSIATPRLAVIPFTDNTGKSQGQGVAELVVTCLQKSKRFSLVDRMEFQKALTEIELSQTDMVDSTSMLRVGKLVAAPFLLTGTIANIFGACKINAKIIRTETMQIYSTAMVTVAPAELDGLTKDLLGEQGKISAALFRSMVAPGWGQFYTNHLVRGGVSLAAFLGGVGFTIYKAQMSADAYQRFENDHAVLNDSAEDWANRISGGNSEKYKAAWDSLWQKDTVNYDTYSRLFDQTVLVGGITIAVYALNLIDAAIAGAKAKRKFKLYFSADGNMNFSMGLAYRF
jgi:TolB-like protein